MKTKLCLKCGEAIVHPRMVYPSLFSRVKYCSKTCQYASYVGRKVSPETRIKMSKAHIGNKSNTGRSLSQEHKENMSRAFKGEKHWNWQGGKTTENHSRRNQLEYKQWRKSVFERDGYKCKIANKDCVHEVHAHHILRFAEHVNLRFDVNNGITLCKNHHPLGKDEEKKMEPTYKQLIKHD